MPPSNGAPREKGRVLRSTRIDENWERDTDSVADKVGAENVLRVSQYVGADGPVTTLWYWAAE